MKRVRTRQKNRNSDCNHQHWLKWQKREQNDEIFKWSRSNNKKTDQNSNHNCDNTPYTEKKEQKKDERMFRRGNFFFFLFVSLALSPSLSLMPLLLIVDCCFDVSKIVLAWVIRMSESQCMPRILWTTGKCYNFNSDRSFSTHSFSVKKKI